MRSADRIDTARIHSRWNPQPLESTAVRNPGSRRSHAHGRHEPLSHTEPNRRGNRGDRSIGQRRHDRDSPVCARRGGGRRSRRSRTVPPSARLPRPPRSPEVLPSSTIRWSTASSTTSPRSVTRQTARPSTRRPKTPRPETPCPPTPVQRPDDKVVTSGRAFCGECRSGPLSSVEFVTGSVAHGR